MDTLTVRKSPLPWWLGGLLLGLVQVLAVAVKGPLGVSTEFVVASSVAMRQVAPDYAGSHKLIGDEVKDGKKIRNKKYADFGYGSWLDVGLVLGALLAALESRRWRLRVTTVWWRASRGRSVAGRLAVGFVAGFLILMGARLAHGCTSGQFASGWAQLSLSAVPFTVMLFGFGMLAARIFYPKVPAIER